MSKPLNAELSFEALVEGESSAMQIRLFSMGVDTAHVQAVQTVLFDVCNSWQGFKVKPFAAALAANRWAEAEVRADASTRYMEVFKYFCAPRIYLNAEVATELGIAYINDGHVVLVSTFSLSVYKDLGSWDDAHKSFFEESRGLRLVGMGNGNWLVVEEEANRNN